jgi:hypothetical protein
VGTPLQYFVAVRNGRFVSVLIVGDLLDRLDDPRGRLGAGLRYVVLAGAPRLARAALAVLSGAATVGSVLGGRVGWQSSFW